MTRFENKRDGVEGGGVNKAETLGRRFSQRVVVDLFFCQRVNFSGIERRRSSFCGRFCF